MAHPRISVSALSSVRWSFDEDLGRWRSFVNTLGDAVDVAERKGTR